MNEQGLIWLVPVVRLYDHGTTVTPSKLLAEHLVKALIALHPETAARLELAEGDIVQFEIGSSQVSAPVTLDETLPQGTAILPRSAGLQVTFPRGVKLVKLAEDLKVQ